MLIQDATNLIPVLVLPNRRNSTTSEKMDLSKVFKGSLVRVIAELRSLVPKGVLFVTEIPFRGV